VVEFHPFTLSQRTPLNAREIDPDKAVEVKPLQMARPINAIGLPEFDDKEDADEAEDPKAVTSSVTVSASDSVSASSESTDPMIHEQTSPSASLVDPADAEKEKLPPDLPF
jgi:hypothetical protein